MIAGLRNVSEDFFDDGMIRSYVEVFDLICKKINILHNDNERFFYFIDTDYVMDTTRGFRYENITPAYDKILTGGFRDLKYSDENTEFRRNYNMVCESICTLIMRIVKEMREATNGKYPRYAVAENVPGIFSSEHGDDFKTVLEEFCKIKDGCISIPKPEKWGNAGLIMGENFSLAWRTIDAQHFGVAQRRRRMYLYVLSV